MTSAQLADPLVGGRYRLVHRLGGGGMGQVWRAVDEILGRPVAVKLLRSELVDDREFLDRFRNEGRRAAGLSHPGIASVFDYGETVAAGRTAFLVMELVEGAPLAALLARERRLDPDRVLDLVAQVALGLQVAHEAGVVHRDIKPSNLLIRDDGVVKLTDFGISRAIGEAPRTEIGLVVGTAAYLSPEQVACRPATPATDIYALGVVAYECLAGRRPFVAKRPAALALAHQRRCPPPLPPDVPGPIRALVEQAMAKDPRRRPTARALARHAAVARTALLEERHQEAEYGSRRASRRSGASHGANGWKPGERTRAAACVHDPGQDTSEWTPVSMQLTRIWTQRCRPAALTAMLGLAILATLLIGAAPQTAPTIIVPSMSGQPIATAGQRLVNAGFKVQEKTTPNRAFKAGIVLAQNPAAGTRLEGGAVVTLTVSTGPAVVTVQPEDYLGQSVDTVRAALIGIGLNVATEPGPPTDQPVGTVVAVAPSGTLRQGDVVTITVASSRPTLTGSAASGGRASAPVVFRHGGKDGHRHGHDDEHGNEE